MHINYWTYKQQFYALADRNTVLSGFRQVFEELGFTIHKQSDAQMIHWPGGIVGRFNEALAYSDQHYKISFSSAGTPDVTIITFDINLQFGWFGIGKKMQQSRLNAFLKKWLDVSKEHHILLVPAEEWQIFLAKHSR